MTTTELTALATSVMTAADQLNIPVLGIAVIGHDGEVILNERCVNADDRTVLVNSLTEAGEHILLASDRDPAEDPKHWTDGR